MTHPHYALLSEEAQIWSCDPAGCVLAKSISEVSFRMQCEFEKFALQKNKVFPLSVVSMCRHTLISRCMFFYYYYLFHFFLFY